MKLKKLEVNSFSGIHPNSPIVIDFNLGKQVTVSGDEHLGKTSLINALLVACGQLSKDNKDFINNDSGKEDINFDFVGKDRLSYSVRVTKSAFTLKYEGEAVPEPISKMKELLGIVGVTPLDIKYKPLKDIVKWLASYSNKSPEEYEEQLDKYKAAIKKSAESRADANKSLKGINEYLNGEDMFNDWEGSEIKYAEPVEIKKLSAELEVAGNKSDKLLQAETKIKQYKERRKKINEELERLNKEAEDVDTAIEKGDTFVSENKDAKTEYDAVKKRYDESAQYVLDYNKWQTIKVKKSERDQFETLAQKHDANEKSLKKELSELQAEILPDIKGVELILEDVHEDGVLKKEGIYWNGRNIRQLSESEVWSLVMMIWRKFKVKIVVIDNAQSLGSNAAEHLERLAKDGAYILCAEMDRSQKTLTIEYK